MSIAFIATIIYTYFIKCRHLKVLKAFSSAGKDGKRFRIKLMPKLASENIRFDELWIDNRLYKFNVVNESNQEAKNNFESKQVLYLDSATHMYDGRQKELPQKLKKHKALIGFIVNNKRRYFSIKKFDDAIMI